MEQAALRAQRESQAAQNKQRKYEQDVAKAVSEFITWSNKQDSPARGQEFPGGKIIRNRAKAKNVELVIYHRAKEGQQGPPKVISGWRLKQDLESQCTGFWLQNHKANVEIRVGPQNIGKKDLAANDVVSDNIFTDIDIFEENYEVGNIQKRFSDKLQTQGLSAADAQKLIQFGTINDPGERIGGLHCLQMVLKGKVTFRYTQYNLSKKDKEAKIAAVEELVTALSSNPVLSIVRQTRTVFNEMDAFWKHRVRPCVNKRIFPFFSEEIDITVGFIFQSWKENPEKTLPHEPWMAKPSDNSNEALKSYAVHVARKFFDTPQHWEIVLSVALVHEIAHENNAIATYFHWGIQHEAKVIHGRGGYGKLEVSVLQKTGDYAIPTVAVNSLMSIRPGEMIVEAAPLATPATAATNPTGDIPMETETTGLAEAPTGDTPMENDGTYQGDEYRCKILDKETTKSFVCFMIINKDKLEISSRFMEGKMIKVELKMKRNNLPSSRQLEAIGIIAKARAENPDRQIWAEYLRDILLGHGAPDLSHSDAKSPAGAGWEYMLHTIGEETFTAYLSSRGMNDEQVAAFNNVMYEPGMINQVQGPPGCGKTALNAIMGTTYALLGHRTVMAAPTNKACEATVNALIDELNALAEHNPEARDLFKAIYMPTSATLKDQLLHPEDYDEDEEAETNDTVDGGVESTRGAAKLKDFMMWTHILKHFRTIARTKMGTAKRAANDWLDTLARIKNGVRVGGKILREFAQEARAAVKDILADPQLKVVVTTSNNSEQLRNLDYECEALIIDESAFGSEQDTYVPLFLFPRYIVLTGDLLQLKPIVISRGHNEYAGQSGMSLFERVLGQNNVPLFRLKVNYRMHPDIALLPARYSQLYMAGMRRHRESHGRTLPGCRQLHGSLVERRRWPCGGLPALAPSPRIRRPGQTIHWATVLQRQRRQIWPTTRFDILGQLCQRGGNCQSRHQHSGGDARRSLSQR
jgi:hypothetical protein